MPDLIIAVLRIPFPQHRPHQLNGQHCHIRPYPYSLFHFGVRKHFHVYDIKLLKTSANPALLRLPEARFSMASYNFPPGSAMVTPFISRNTRAAARAVLLLPSTKG